jgi:hypothetical protein
MFVHLLRHDVCGAPKNCRGKFSPSALMRLGWLIAFALCAAGVSRPAGAQTVLPGGFSETQI